ncbi:hypothetical protein [Erwinia phage phiEaP8]|uniref:Uncharacterized protein n=1 Tax=Erwinia phage phiEaP8 TaxID=2178928 RepID=A0A3G1QTS2_9CAUD|nr:hypothetical protein HYP64_gp29 [Erwinia phage phiEaP8]AWN06263.1 hypothetical protein [Erwinia phage phiEaP8]
MHEFLRKYKEWLDAGAPEAKPFSRTLGLCGNMKLSGHYDYKYQLRNALKRDFDDVVYPFNNGMGIGYVTEKECQTMHENKERIAWVERMLREE